jgi:hypothetical protein
MVPTDHIQTLTKRVRVASNKLWLSDRPWAVIEL